jgi:hypothetical protein
LERNKIIEEFYNSKEVNEAISKMHPVELQDDLKAELFLILCELDEQKLLDLYEKKQLRFYLVRILLNLVQSTDKKFYQKYRNFTEYKQEERADEVTEAINVLEPLEDLYWYNRKVFELYVHEFKCNAKELSRKTGIPYISVVRTINQTKQILRKKIRQ